MCVCVCFHAHVLVAQVLLFATPWTVAHQAPLSTGFFRQEYWSELAVPSSGDLPNPGTEPKSPTLQADSLLSEPPGKPSTEGEGKKTPFLLFQDKRSFKISDYIVLHV